MSQLKTHLGPFIALSQYWWKQILEKKINTEPNCDNVDLHTPLSVFEAKTTYTIPPDTAVCLKFFWMLKLKIGSCPFSFSFLQPTET